MNKHPDCGNPRTASNAIVTETINGRTQIFRQVIEMVPTEGRDGKCVDFEVK